MLHAKFEVFRSHHLGARGNYPKLAPTQTIHRLVTTLKVVVFAKSNGVI